MKPCLPEARHSTSRQRGGTMNHIRAFSAHSIIFSIIQFKAHRTSLEQEGGRGRSFFIAIVSAPPQQTLLDCSPYPFSTKGPIARPPATRHHNRIHHQIIFRLQTRGGRGRFEEALHPAVSKKWIFPLSSNHEISSHMLTSPRQVTPSIPRLPPPFLACC